MSKRRGINTRAASDAKDAGAANAARWRYSVVLRKNRKKRKKRNPKGARKRRSYVLLIASLSCVRDNLRCRVEDERQPSPSGRRKSLDFKRRRPATSMHCFVIRRLVPKEVGCFQRDRIDRIYHNDTSLRRRRGKYNTFHVVSALQAFRRHVNRNRGRRGPGRGCAGPSALVYRAQTVDVSSMLVLN